MRRTIKDPMNPPMHRNLLRVPIAGATVLCAIAFVWVLAGIAVTTPTGLRLDTRAMQAVYARSDVITQILSYLGYISIGTASAALFGLVLVAASHGDVRAGVAAVILVLGANITTQIIKKFILHRPDWFDQLPNSLPSGHTTLMISLVLAALFVVPSALRYPALGAGAMLATLTGTSTVVAGWHRPADVLAALGVCLAWGVLVGLALRRPNHYRFISAFLWAFSGTIIAGVILVFIGVRPRDGWPGITDAAIVLTTLATATSLTLALFARVISPFGKVR